MDAEGKSEKPDTFLSLWQGNIVIGLGQPASTMLGLGAS